MKICFTAIMLLSATPTLAQDVFHPPNGCTGVLTIQNRNCMLTNLWQCEGDAPGQQWIALFNENGPYRVKQIDAEFQWLTTFYLNPAWVETMQLPAPDPESITELLANGVDTYDFTIVNEDTGTATRIRGYDRLTGDVTQINGVDLHHTEYQYDIVSADGNVTQTNSGRQFVSAAHRIFVLGEAWNSSNPEHIRDSSPIEIIHPGETGFFSPHPKYECSMMMSSLPNSDLSEIPS